MFPVVPGKKGRDTMGFTDKNVVVPEWGGSVPRSTERVTGSCSCRNLLDLGESLLKHSEL